MRGASDGEVLICRMTAMITGSGFGGSLGKLLTKEQMYLRGKEWQGWRGKVTAKILTDYVVCLHVYSVYSTFGKSSTGGRGGVYTFTALRNRVFVVFLYTGIGKNSCFHCLHHTYIY